MSSDPTSWSHAIQTWFDEIKDFDYGIGPKYKDAVVGHYTQVRETNEKDIFAINALKGELIQILNDSNVESGGRSEAGKEQSSHFVGISGVSCHLSKACRLLIRKHTLYFLNSLNG